MRVHPDERPEKEAGRNKVALWIGVVIVLAGLALLSYFFLTPTDETPVTMTTPEVSTPALPAPTPATTNPVADIEETVPEQPPQPTTSELPSLDDSDEFARRQFTELAPDDQLGQWFPPNHVLRRTVSLLDGLSRGDVLRKMLRAPTPKGSFAVVPDGQKRSISPTNYQRYNYLVDTLDAMDNEKLIKLFHLLRPLLEQAYGELGYPPESVDKAVISAATSTARLSGTGFRSVQIRGPKTGGAARPAKTADPHGARTYPADSGQSQSSPGKPAGGLAPTIRPSVAYSLHHRHDCCLLMLHGRPQSLYCLLLHRASA